MHSRWPNTLAPQHRFDTQKNKATALARQLSSGSPEISLFWVKLTTVEVPGVAPEEADLNVELVPSQHKAVCKLEEVVLLDYLIDDHTGVVDDEDAVERPTIPVEITWVASKVHLNPCHVNRPE